MVEKLKKISVILLLFSLFAFSGIGVAVNAAETRYFMIEGRIYRNDVYHNSSIERVEIVDNIQNINRAADPKYAIIAYDMEWYQADIVGFDVDFHAGADSGGGELEYAKFIAFIPYNENIQWFDLVNSEDILLAEKSILPLQVRISYFDVKETDEGFELSWDTELSDSELSDDLDYDITAVSTVSGERNMIAYRMKEKKLTVPYEWLEPNDTIVFELASNDTKSTLTKTSAQFSTPDGEGMSITDDEWLDTDSKTFEWSLKYTIILIAVCVGIAGIIVVIVIMKKAKTNMPEEK